MALKCNITNPAFGENVVFADAYIRVKEAMIRSATSVQMKTNVLETDTEGNPLRAEQVPDTDANGNVIFTTTHTVVGNAFAYADQNARALDKAPVAIVNFAFELPDSQSGNIVEWIYTQLKAQAQFAAAVDV